MRLLPYPTGRALLLLLVKMILAILQCGMLFVEKPISAPAKLPIERATAFAKKSVRALRTFSHFQFQRARS
jgi:hypothetical protein